MKLVIQERDEETDEVLETVILDLFEPEGKVFSIEEVEEEDDHWANHFRTWRYSVKNLRETVVADGNVRRAEWRGRIAARDAAASSGEVG